MYDAEFFQSVTAYGGGHVADIFIWIYLLFNYKFTDFYGTDKESYGAGNADHNQDDGLRSGWYG